MLHAGWPPWGRETTQNRTGDEGEQVRHACHRPGERVAASPPLDRLGNLAGGDIRGYEKRHTELVGRRHL